MGLFVQLTVVAVIGFFSNADSLCVRKLAKNQVSFSFLVPLNVKEIPEDYRNIVNNETECILFMDLNWDENVEIQFNLFRIRPIFVYPTIRIVTTEDSREALQDTNIRRITRSSNTQIAGNSIRSFAIIYNKRVGLNSPFLLRIKAVRTRRLFCPDLENEFGVVTCSNGNEFGSECTFQCKDGFHPSPDLFNGDTESEILKAFRSSPEHRFFSVCSLTERRRPAWKPDGLTLAPSQFGIKWKDVFYEWKCVERKVVEDVCLVPRHTLKLAKVDFFGVSHGQLSFFYASNSHCLYPPAYLLSIYGEEKDGEVTTTTTTTTTAAPTTTTTTPQFETGLVIVPQPLPSQVDESQAVGDGSVNCAIYCKIDSSTNAYTPKCGIYPTDDEQIDCLTCRYVSKSCTQRSAV